MISTIGAIALGGAFGALARHFFNTGVLAVMKTDFPLGIFLANILGSFIMGILVAIFAGVGEPPQAVKAFLAVGFLGAFTTFSTFSLDTMLLWTRGDMTGVATYVFGSVILSVGAVFLGSWLVWKFIA